MDGAEWEERIEAIHEEFYEQIVTTAECGPFDGGCVVTAQALRKVIGGDIVVLVRPDDRADHAVVLKDDQLWDFDGPLPPDAFIQRFNATELSGMPFQCVSYRPIRETDLDKAYRGDELVEKLEALFRQALEPQIAPAP
ncbi:hypothetical protein [Mesorhizobium sp. SP-1A]|uniref:hypothetical protein n=1 Tax=Mesorhizobium sp. SP-1A TaxID=3077840 RepID=UPI0028F73F94|nr:hypothetical protein [Mesorhizobium sp. SP-1A]